MKKSYTNQITIIHLSDLHFGDKHICNPEDPTGSRDGLKDLGDWVIQDLQSEELIANFTSSVNTISQDAPPIIVAISGDFTQKAAINEFEEASIFLEKIIASNLLNQKIVKSDIFMIPGNHDVEFNEASSHGRFLRYCDFYNTFYEGVSSRSTVLAKNAESLTQVHTFEKNNNKVLFAEINCCMYVKNDTIDKSRGQVSQVGISKLRAELERISSQGKFDEYIKIAMIHHHIVLMPSFIEAGRGVDSVVNARQLLELLNEYNFHLILHGHKHYPHIFSYDPEPLWNESQIKIPQIIISGGSCGSTELPTGSKSACNTYSLITVKWHPAAQQSRIRVTTRGLNRKGQGNILNPDLWTWSTVNISDKILAPYQTIPKVGTSKIYNWDTDKRADEYSRLRGQMPVVEVMPSLIIGQAYEARAWILSHGNQLDDTNKLLRVEWSAGEKFKFKQIAHFDMNPNFCVSYQYWGAMLIEAKLVFNDGYEACSYVYARLPKQEPL